MNRILTGACALAPLIPAALLAAGCSASDRIPETTIGVDALMVDPQAFAGEIAVTGVVQNISPDGQMLQLIDVEEYEECGLLPCASAGILPLHVPTSGAVSVSGDTYAGEMPQLEETVMVIGTVRSAEGGLYFDVERVLRGSTTLISKQR